MADSWSDIAASRDSSTVTLRRADAGHPLDLYRGKDWQGNYLFCFHGSVSSSEGMNLPKLGNIDVEVGPLPPGSPATWELCLKLREPANVDIFRALCADLMRATEALGRGDDDAGIEIIVARLRRWQDLLKTRRERTLSLQERIGLFGELLVLRDVFQPTVDCLDAARAWRGPHGDEQDFLYGHWNIEVKTQLASADRAVTVSSEDQLHTSSGGILLCHQSIGVDGQDGSDARSLNELVREVAGFFEDRDTTALDLFHATLMEHGYEELSDYDSETWRLRERSFFEVRDGFPRLVPANLPNGVEGVRYAIRIGACEPFRVTEPGALEWILRGS